MVSFFSEKRIILQIVDYDETYKEAIDNINELMQTYDNENFIFK